jgi:hypothetical protein
MRRLFRWLFARCGDCCLRLVLRVTGQGGRPQAAAASQEINCLDRTFRLGGGWVIRPVGEILLQDGPVTYLIPRLALVSPNGRIAWPIGLALNVPARIKSDPCPN